MQNQTCSVLIVEDDEKLLDLIRTIIKRDCTTIDVASDGERAIEMLQQSRYDAVVLDLMLPKKSGILVAEALETFSYRPRIIVLSAISRYFHHAFPAGTLVLQKPFEIERLQEAISSVRADLRRESPPPSAGPAPI